LKRRIFVLLGLTVLMMATLAVAATVASAQNTQSTTTVPLKPVGGSGVSGTVHLRQVSGGGTHIDVTAMGLKPHSKHVSLYYDNHVCRFEPYSQNDVIGGNFYKANGKGVGHTSGNVDDNLDKINSVSVRDALTFRLLACADIHP
jgi:hypothetical protein